MSSFRKITILPQVRCRLQAFGCQSSPRTHTCTMRRTPSWSFVIGAFRGLGTIIRSVGARRDVACTPSSVRVRDYARFGQLYLQEGMWDGAQIVPREWVRASRTPDAPHLLPGPNKASTSEFGYGYQWWIPPEADGDFLGIGIYNQYIYVYPRYNVVIAKSSAYPDYDGDGDERTMQSIAAFRTIAARGGE